ncbi:MAG: GNAT family N-acetyltransferase [Woeseiaceae bacterium]|nr:GNAT family N-acetyltransferase [Woeseiaceae bacterium]
MPEALIRNYEKLRHHEGVRLCLVELQDFERRLDPRMPPGAEIVDAYIDRMLERCDECGGRILVAEIDGGVAGYATILPKVKSDEIEDGNLEYGLVSDLVVTEEFRGMGIGKRLLTAAEAYARKCRVRWLRIGVLARNQVPRQLYESAGFAPQYIELEKALTKS